jgi:hypothetical protein
MKESVAGVRCSTLGGGYPLRSTVGLATVTRLQVGRHRLAELHADHEHART